MAKNEEKKCINCQAKFIIEPDDFTFYEKIDVPAPTWCPDCRQQRRMMFRNFKTLYNSKSDKSGEPMISMYHPDSPYKVYTHQEWWADDWDASEYGRDFDFSRPFFEQFRELELEVPRFNFMNTNSVNCEYSNFTFGSKNCYMVFGCVDDEDCAYGHIVWESKDSFDNLYVRSSELCYECTDCLGSYQLFYSQECDSCTESVGLYDCRECLNCIGCVGLIKKSHHIFNQPVSKEEYDEFLKKYPLHDSASIEYILKEREKLRKKVPQRHFFGHQNSNVSGNHVYGSHNMLNSFDVQNGENSRYVFTSRNTLDAHDIAFSPDTELSYEVINAIHSNRLLFVSMCPSCSEVSYSSFCHNSPNLFGCAGVKKGEYMILNKKYSKEDYLKLKEKIIEHMKKTGEWGNFFPISLSPFAYNESIANEYIPLTKDEATKKGYGWQDDILRTKGQETIKPEDLPSKPDYYTDALTKEVLKCEDCSGNYRLIQREVDFYKKMGLSLPTKCFNCRHQARMNQRQPRTLHSGKCSKCSEDFQTSYSPEQQKKYQIYCQSCYRQEMV